MSSFINNEALPLTSSASSFDDNSEYIQSRPRIRRRRHSNSSNASSIESNPQQWQRQQRHILASPSSMFTLSTHQQQQQQQQQNHSLLCASPEHITNEQIDQHINGGVGGGSNNVESTEVWKPVPLLQISWVYPQNNQRHSVSNSINTTETSNNTSSRQSFSSELLSAQPSHRSFSSTSNTLSPLSLIHI